MQVPEGLLPEVKEHNLIRYSREDGVESDEMVASGSQDLPPPQVAGTPVYATATVGTPMSC